jgi:hypothetical protein
MKQISEPELDETNVQENERTVRFLNNQIFGLRVLIVEDNIIHYTLLLDHLTDKIGIFERNITSAFDGIQALNTITQNLE